MRILPTFLVYFASLGLAAQECAYVKNEIDPFTKKETIITDGEVVGYATIEGNSIRINAARLEGAAVLYIESPRVRTGCVKADSKVIFLFEDGSTLELEHATAADCEYATFILMAKSAQFKGKTVKRVRLGLSDAPLDCEVTNPTAFERHLVCVKN